MKVFAKKYKINSSTENIFKALTSSTLISKWSGSKATMNAKEGSKFSLWNGSIIGKNIKVDSNQIIQEWKEIDWDEFSKVTFNITSNNKISTVELIHENIPEDKYDSIKSGWDEYYMLPLKALVETM